MDHTEHRLGTSYSHDSSLTVPTALCGQQLSNSPHQASRDCVSQAETPSLTSTPPLSTAVSSKSGKSPFISHLSTTPRPSAALGHSAPNQPSAYPTPPQTIQRAIEAGKMSTLGIHFDPHFDPISRASYSWPLFDMAINEQFHEQSIVDSFCLSPELVSYCQPLKDSPSPVLFSPEQREPKRQRDLARRGNKSQKRRYRAATTPYQSSHNGCSTASPSDVGNLSSNIPQQSVAAQYSPTFHNSGFHQSIQSTTSSESPELFGQHFPLVSEDHSIHPFLVPPFPATLESNTPVYTTRPHSLSSVSDQLYFYHTTPLPSQQTQDSVKVVYSRPKPQCWDHGCNGRHFSTFSNLLRHQREKSGISSKPSCPKCGAEFTRTTARNGHMAHEKCKQRRNSTR